MSERAISLPFSFNSLGEVSYTTDEKKIVQDRVVMAVMTKFGERVMRPNYGSDIYRSLFENIEESSDSIVNAVTVCFSTWLSDLELTAVKPQINVDNGSIEVEIEYRRGLIKQTQSIKLTNGLFSRSGDLIREA